jgi:hypothetical protein
MSRLKDHSDSTHTDEFEPRIGLSMGINSGLGTRDKGMRVITTSRQRNRSCGRRIEHDGRLVFTQDLHDCSRKPDAIRAGTLPSESRRVLRLIR